MQTWSKPCSHATVLTMSVVYPRMLLLYSSMNCSHHGVYYTVCIFRAVHNKFSMTSFDHASWPPQACCLASQWSISVASCIMYMIVDHTCAWQVSVHCTEITPYVVHAANGQLFSNLLMEFWSFCTRERKWATWHPIVILCGSATILTQQGHSISLRVETLEVKSHKGSPSRIDMLTSHKEGSYPHRFLPGGNVSRKEVVTWKTSLIVLDTYQYALWSVEYILHEFNSISKTEFSFQ